MIGVLNLDKPAGISSARAVSRVKRLLPRGTKIGHAGTLDPFATGVLLLLVGRATKWSGALMSEPKQYEATVKFGATTETDDPDAPEITYFPTGAALQVPALPAITRALASQTGPILQRPPAYSALKIDGHRAYHLARQGKEVQLEPRKVDVYGIELLTYDWPLLRLRIDCGRGTYIRAIARDLGQALDVGGYLTALRRTRVGPFEIDTAVSLDTLDAANVEQHLRLYVPRSVDPATS